MGGKKQKFSILTVSLIPVCVAINVVGGQIASAIKLPIFMDSIGTFLVALLCGPIPGAVAGILTAVVSAMFSPIMLSYLPVTMVYGLIAGLLAKKNMMSSVKRVLILGIIMAGVGVLCSSIITAFVFGGITETGQSIIIAFLRTLGFGVFPATLLSSLFTEACDKILSLFICYFIILSMSSRYLSRLPLGEIYLKNRRK